MDSPHTETYNIKIDHFEGPFDLILFFIERDELDIYDIPIAEITEDFLEYIRELEKLNINVASEFILVAATLMKIKSRILIPRKPLDEDGNEIDPREELVQKLLEYQRYKAILNELESLSTEQNERHLRGNTLKEIKELSTKALVDIELENLSLFQLLKAYRNILEKMEDRKNKESHTIVRYDYNIQDKQKDILRILDNYPKASFTQIFDHAENRVEAIVIFLSLLDLINSQEISIVQGLGANNFTIKRA